MITFTDSQTAILAESHHVITYLFETSGLYLSHKNYNYGGQEYEAKVPMETFSGISLSAAKSEHGIQAPNDFSFTIANKNNSLSVSDFKNSGVFNSVTVRLLINGVQFRVFKFRITGIDDIGQRLHVRAEDYLKKFLEGEWPNEVQVSSLAPDDTGAPDGNLCLPVPFGTCYIPIRGIYTDSDRFYMLGPADGVTYTITEVTSPHEWPLRSSWSSGSFTFEQSTKTIDGVNYRCFRPLVADGNNAAWQSGDYYLDPLVQFSRSDLSSTTDFADVIQYVLEDFGIPSAMIDSASFAAAKSTHTSWGISFNYAFFFPEDRAAVISNILNACNSTLIFNEKIELKVLDRTVRATIDTDEVYNEDGSSFTPTGTVSETEFDAAHIAFQESGSPQDRLAKCVVVADGGSSYSNLSQEVLQVPYIQNSVHAQRAGELWAQRKFTGSQKFSFDGKRTLLALEPNDTIQIDNARYGGTFEGVIDSINFHVRPTFSFIKYSSDLEDWGDNTPNSVTITADNTADPWALVTVGPDSSPSSGSVPNILRGKLRIGTGADCIIIDPDTYSITVVENSNDFLVIGEVDTDDFGIQGNDASGNKVFKVSTSGAEIGGWTIEENKISITGLELDADNNRFRAYTGSNYVDITAAGLIGYDSVLGQTFKLLTDGSAPEFSSGVIKECEYQIYTSGVIRTDADPASNGGLLINNQEIKGYNSSGALTFQVVYDGTDQGDFLLGGSPASAHGVSYDHSSGQLDIAANLTVLSGSDITINDGGDLVIKSGGDIYLEAESGDRAVIDFEVDNSRSIRIAADHDDERLSIFPSTDDYCHFSVGYDQSGANKRFDTISIQSTDFSSLRAYSSASNSVKLTLDTSPVYGDGKGIFSAVAADGGYSFGGTVTVSSNTSGYPYNYVSLSAQHDLSGGSPQLTVGFKDLTTSRIKLDADFVEIDQGADDGEALRFVSSDIAHGITGEADTDVFASLGKANASAGGVDFTGYTEAGHTGPAIRLIGIKGDTDHSEYAPVEVYGYEKDGTGLDFLSGSDRMFVVRNYLTEVFVVTAGGDGFFSGDILQIGTSKTPASASASGSAGSICWDTNYIYACVASNTWKRAALLTW